MCKNQGMGSLGPFNAEQQSSHHSSQCTRRALPCMWCSSKCSRQVGFCMRAHAWYAKGRVAVEGPAVAEAPPGKATLLEPCQ